MKLELPKFLIRCSNKIEVNLGLFNQQPNPSLTMRSSTSSGLLGALRSLRISPATVSRPSIISTPQSSIPTAPALAPRHVWATTAAPQGVRMFSATATRAGNWLEPSIDRKKKMMKGRARCPTGGSTKGTTVMWGDYGLRMTDHHRRISAQQLKIAEDTIKQRLRGQKYRLYKRVCCNIGVFVSGNEVRLFFFFFFLCLPRFFFSLQSERKLTTWIRCVWVREKVPSTIGRREWQ